MENKKLRKILNKVENLEKEINLIRDLLNSEFKTDNTLRSQIIDLIKENEKNGGIHTDDLKKNLNYSSKEINKECIKLLEQGVIFEPRPAKLRWLG